MKLLSLQLSNFTNHKDSFIDFKKLPLFSIIVGVENDSFGDSNGTGKTNIFNAIDYCLFDSKFSNSKDKIILDGESKCEVKLEFEKDNVVYCIKRYKTKSTQGVKLYKNIDGKLEDLSDRTTSQTNESIVKLIGVNERSFKNSFYLQQNDYSRRKVNAFAAATPEERKSIISDMLNLTVWNEYENASKVVLASLKTEITQNEYRIKALGDPGATIEKNASSVFNCDTAIVQLNHDKIEHVKVLNQHKDQLKILQTSLSTELPILQSQFAKKQTEMVELNAQVQRLEKQHAKNVESVSNVESTNQKLVNAINDLKQKLTNHEQLCLCNVDKIYKYTDQEYIDICNVISEKEAELRSCKAELSLVSRPIPKDKICPECGTELNENHRHTLQQTKDTTITKLRQQIATLTDEISKHNAAKLKHENNIRICTNEENVKNELLQNINKNEKLLSNNIILIEQYTSLSASSKEDYNLKIDQFNLNLAEFNELKQKYLELKTASESIRKEIVELQELVGKEELEINYIDSMLEKTKRTKYEAEAQITVQEEKLVQLNEEIKNSKELSRKYNIAKIGTSCFGKHGIQAMIIKSILDSLQNETNKILDEIKPGASVQFIVSKERDDGVKVDTLNIVFNIKGKAHDFSELSGGQQCLFVTALKIAMVQISRNRCSSDIKLLLLDETDQALDATSVDGLHRLMKKISKEEDINIILITHNANLQEKFDQIILVKNDGGAAYAQNYMIKRSNVAK